nr:hypothetical protein [Tanacetum cinerariifolium]
MRDEHLDTISATESNEFIKSSVENLVPIPSESEGESDESEVTFDNESECDVPVNEESSPIFTTFSNTLFDCNDNFTSSDDESLSNEDAPMEKFKVYSNSLFDDEEIIYTKIDSVEVPEKQKQKMEDTMFDLVEICHHKQFLCIHDDIDNLIESALYSKLLSIKSINSQRLDKKEQEVKNVEEQQAERRNHAEKSLQSFRVIHKSSISVNSTSQISSIHAVSPIQSTEEPEHLLSMGYEHFSITPETESDAVNLLPIPSKCEVTLEDKIECDMPAKDDCSLVFTTFSNPLFKDNDDLDSSNDESLLMKISDDVLPPSVDNDDDLSLLEEADLFLSDNLIPPGIENVADDQEEDVHFLEELLINDSILSHESFDSNLEENPSIPRPPPEPPDVQSFFDLKPDVIAEEISDKLNEDICFDPKREINVSTKIEDDDYFPFMFVIRFFLSYFIFPEVSPLLLSPESEDTIFDPGISD